MERTDGPLSDAMCRAEKFLKFWLHENNILIEHDRNVLYHTSDPLSSVLSSYPNNSSSKITLILDRHILAKVEFDMSNALHFICTQMPKCSNPFLRWKCAWENIWIYRRASISYAYAMQIHVLGTISIFDKMKGKKKWCCGKTPIDSYCPIPIIFTASF